MPQKNIIIPFLAIFLYACLTTKVPAPVGYVRDDLYCWKLGADDVWRTQGLSHECPEGTVEGRPTVIPKTKK